MMTVLDGENAPVKRVLTGFARLALAAWGSAAAQTSPLTFDEFRDAALAQIRAHAPGDETAEVEGANSIALHHAPRGEMRIDITGYYRDYLHDPSRMDRVMGRLVGLATAQRALDLDHLVVSIEPRAALEQSGTPLNGLQIRPLAGDVVEILAMESLFDFDLLGAYDLSELHVSAEEAWSRATANIAHRAQPLVRALGPNSLVGAPDAGASVLLAASDFCTTSPWADDAILVLSDDYFLALPNLTEDAVRGVARLRAIMPHASATYLRCQEGRLALWAPVAP